MLGRPSSLDSNKHQGSPHPEFLGAGSEAGLEIWRIEDKVPVLWPKEKHGTFCSGDSYICLKTTISKSGHSWDIHFWLGKESSVDEVGIAAIKTVELDDSLGGLPNQYRETQGYESSQFQSLFKKHIMYLDGGVASAFRHVERDEYPVRFFHLKGKRNVRVTQIPLSSDMNSGDVFILDMGLKIFQWNGKESNKFERAKALDVVVQMNDEERQGRAEIIRVDEGSEPEGFWSFFGDHMVRVKSAADGGDDTEAEQKGSKERKMFRVRPAGDSASFDPVNMTGKLKVGDLKHDGIFLVDCGLEVFLWIGSKAPKEERSLVMKFAQLYITQNGKPKHTVVSKVSHDAETPLFKDKFSDWPRVSAKVDWSRVGSGSGPPRVAAAPKEVAVDDLARAMSSSAQRTSSASQRQQFGDGSGNATVWRVESFDLKPVPKETYGQFYSGDSYVILYEYLDNNKEAFVIYFWLGRNSTPDEIGTAALKTKELDDQYGGLPIQVRVSQNKEPTHFLRLFKGLFIVHDGGNPSGFKTGHADLEHHDGTGLYHIRGHDEITTRAVQVKKEAGSLNSCDSFVLLLQDKVYAWYGTKCTPDERETSKRVAHVLRGNRKEIEINEGNEPEEFWAELGGKTAYPEGAPDEDIVHAPRLFQCSNASGGFQVEEIVDFCQDDLTFDDTFILDIWKELYVWVGPEANELEKRKVMELAETYVEASQEDRSGTPIVKVLAGKEPHCFTCHFLGWDHHKAQVFEDPYEQKMKQLQSSAGAGPSTPPPAFSGVSLRKTATPDDFHGGPTSSLRSETVTPPSGAAAFGAKLKSASASPAPAFGTPASTSSSPGQLPFAVKLKSTGRSLSPTQDEQENATPPVHSLPGGTPARASVTPGGPPTPQGISGLQELSSPATTPSGGPSGGGGGGYADPAVTKFPYEDLKNRSPAVEQQVDPTKRVNYLSPQEIKEVMGCTLEEFEGMKEWKKTELKKKTGLF